MEAFGRIWALGCTSWLVYGAFEWVRGLIIAQNHQIYDFWALSMHFHFENLVLNTFSGSTNLSRLLGEYGHLGVLLCWYMGLLSGSEGLKIAQNDQINCFRAL